MIFILLASLLNHFRARSESRDGNCYRIGILGAAYIAPKAIIEPARKIPNCVVYAVAARNVEKAKIYANEHGIEKVFKSYEDMINAKDVDIIFNALPNGYHAYYSIMALKAGKHVLCEKPSAANANEVDAIANTLKIAPLNEKTGTKPRFLEAFHNQFHPLSIKLQNCIKQGDYGEIKSIEVNLSLTPGRVPETDIRYNNAGKNPELAGGSLMDLGCYATSIIRVLVASNGGSGNVMDCKWKITKAVIEEAFEHTKGVDRSADVELVMSNKSSASQVQGKINVGFNSPERKMFYVIHGTKKSVYVDSPLSIHKYHLVTETDISTGKKTSWTCYCDKSSTYDFQLRAFISMLDGVQDSADLCEHIGGVEVAKQNMEIVDDIYYAAGAKPRIGLSSVRK